ncbi:hypothetical protein L7F22_047967 [Adiantum nelumboides]|nr:hypothetical protein [Adiantum nelumboides]
MGDRLHESHELMSSIQYDGRALLTDKDGSKVQVMITRDIVNEALHFYPEQAIHECRINADKDYISSFGLIEDLPSIGSQAFFIQHARFVAKPVKTTTTAASSRSTRLSKKSSSDDEKTNTDKEQDPQGSDKEEGSQKEAESKGPSKHEPRDEEDMPTPLDRKNKKPHSETQIAYAEAQAKVEARKKELADASAAKVAAKLTKSVTMEEARALRGLQYASKREYSLQLKDDEEPCVNARPLHAHPYAGDAKDIDATKLANLLDSVTPLSNKHKTEKSLEKSARRGKYITSEGLEIVLDLKSKSKYPFIHSLLFLGKLKTAQQPHVFEMLVKGPGSGVDLVNRIRLGGNLEHMWVHVHRVQGWPTMSAHVYDPFVRELLTIATCKFTVENKHAQVEFWRMLNSVVQDQGFEKPNFKNFMADEANANWIAVKTLRDPLAVLQWIEFEMRLVVELLEEIVYPWEKRILRKRVFLERKEQEVT